MRGGEREGEKDWKKESEGVKERKVIGGRRKD